MAPPTKKAKQATKGSKQIVEENEKTIIFYRNMSVGASAVYFLLICLLFIESFTAGIIVLSCIATLAHVISYHLLRYAAKITYAEDGKMLDCGTDLNMEGGITEHVKDLVILMSGTQLLSLLSNYFWLLLLLVPLQGCVMLWKTLAPNFFQTNVKEPEVEEKKSKRNKYN